MSFGIYSIGFAIVIAGLVYAAYLLHIPAHWIGAGAVVLLGIGILTGVKATRQKDTASWISRIADSVPDSGIAFVTISDSNEVAPSRIPAEIQSASVTRGYWS
jgi:hypothetical protein